MRRRLKAFLQVLVPPVSMAVIGMVLGYVLMGRGPGETDVGLAVTWIWHGDDTLRIIAYSWPRQANRRYALYFDHGALVEHQPSADGWLIQDIHVAKLTEDLEIRPLNGVAREAQE
jgi:hypothetical protein